MFPLRAWQRLRAFFARDLWTLDPAALGLPGRVGVRLLRLAVVAAAEFRVGFLDLRAAGLVYTTLLSLVPFLAVTFSLLKAFGAHYRLEPVLAEMLAPLGPRGAEITSQVLGFVDNLKVGVLGAVGVAGLFYTAISLINKIEESLNHIWRVRRPRTLGRKFTDYLSVVVVGPILVVAALTLTASAQSHWLVQRVLAIGPVGAILVPVAGRVMPLVFLTAAFTFLYKMVPCTRVRFASALIGGATAAVLWQVASAAFAAFVAQSPRYTAIYSSFAILILFLLWLYVVWLIVLVGAQVAYFHQHPATYLSRLLRGGGYYLVREQLALTALGEIARRHLAGAPPYGTDALADAVDAPPATVEELIDRFVGRGILVRTAEPEGVTLARPPESVALADVLDAVRGPADGGTGLAPGGPAAVARVLARRDEAVRRALDGATLRSLATGESPGA